MDQNQVELENPSSTPNPDPKPNPMEESNEEEPIIEETAVGEGEIGNSPLHGDEAAAVAAEEPEPEHKPEPDPEPEPEPAAVPVKRKRGRPPKSQALKAAPTKKEAVAKKAEEDVCFICFDGGNLVVCDRRGCPKVYHPVCVNRDDAFFQTKARWNCGWHICSICAKAAHYMCYTCTYSLCKGCVKEARFVCVRGSKGFCETCYDTVLQIESKGDANQAKVGDKFDDSNAFECLFKYYWFDVKARLSLTLEELKNAKSPLKGSGASARNEESSDESYNANDDPGDSSDSSSGRHESSSSKKKGRKRSRANAADVTAILVDNGGAFITEGTKWASKELLEFVSHMKGGDMSVVSQFDVQSLLLEYIKQNNLRDPRRKSQIVCDPRLENLFGKARVGHFEMLKLLESHFLIKEPTQVVTDDNEGGLLDPDFGQDDAEGYNDGAMKLSYDKRRKSRKKVEEKEPQSNLDDYAAIDVHNINLIYLRRNLMEDLLDDVDKFNENVVGCFVRIRISGTGQKQDLYRLVQVVGTSKAAEKYKTGRKATDYTLEILNLDKTEVVTIDTISNQEFTEEECRRLRQSVKCGLINRLTVGDVQEKSRSLQPVRVNDWLESEKLRLGHLRDRASETGRRKDLRECVEKLHLLSNPEEHRRRLNEVPQIHADPNMDPDYESAEEGDTDDQYPGTFSRARELSTLRKGRDVISPQARVPASSNWAAARKSLNTGLESSKNTKAEDARDTWETARGQSSALEPVVWSNNQLAKETVQPCSATPESTSSPSEASETKKIWYYKDPAGKIQGPFCVIQLRKWSSSGYFPEDMRIWQDSENQEDSILLTDALNGKFEKDLPPWEPPQSHYAQPSVLVAGTDNTAIEQEGWRGINNTTLLDRNQNWHILAGNVNTTLPNASWSARRMEVVNPVDARSVASPGGWEPSLNRGWSGPPQAHNSTRLIAPFSDISHEPLSSQSNGDNGGNTGRWNQGQDRGTNPIPGGQHSNWSSLGQSSRNHWGNDIYNPPTATLQQGSNMDWPSAQGSLKSPPSPTPVPPLGAGWGALYQSPGANLEQNKTAPVGNFSGSLGLSSLSKPPNFTGMLGTNVQFPQKFEGLVDSREPNQRADAAVLGVYTRTEFSEGVISNQFFESECPSPTPRIERPETTSPHDELDPQKKWPDANKGLGSAPSCVGPASVTSHLPTALQPKADNSESMNSNAAEGLQVLANSKFLSSEPDDNMSPIKDKEVKLRYPASGTMLPRESSISELLLNQISDGLAPTSAQRRDINGPSLKPAPLGNRWEQIQTKKQESSVQRPELLKVEGPQDIVKGEEWSLPSPTPSSKPSPWNKGTDFTTGHSQNNPWCTYAQEQSSQTGGVAGSEDAPSRSWGLAPQNVSMLAGPAQGEPNGGCNTAIQGKTNTDMESLPRGNANVGWAIPAQGNTTWNAGWATSATHGRVEANKGFEVPEENSNATAGWGMAAQVNANPNTDWGIPSPAKSNLNTGWGAPSHGHANPNTSLVSMPQGDTAPVWGQANYESVKTNSGWPAAVGWGTGLQDTSAVWGTKQYQQEDRYRVGLDNDLKPDSRHGGNSRRSGDSWYDSRYDGWTSQRDGRVDSDRGGGSSRLSPKGGVQGRGQTGICKFHESGYCKKGASCKYRHL